MSTNRGPILETRANLYSVILIYKRLSDVLTSYLNHNFELNCYLESMESLQFIFNLKLFLRSNHNYDNFNISSDRFSFTLNDFIRLFANFATFALCTGFLTINQLNVNTYEIQNKIINKIMNRGMKMTKCMGIKLHHFIQCCFKCFRWLNLPDINVILLLPAILFNWHLFYF